MKKVIAPANTNTNTNTSTNTTKKVIALVLAALMTLSFITACGNNNKAGDAGSSTSSDAFASSASSGTSGTANTADASSSPDASSSTNGTADSTSAAPAGAQNVDLLRIGVTYPNEIFSLWSQRSAYGQTNYHSFSQLNLWRVDAQLGLTGDGCFFDSWDVSEDNLELILHFSSLGRLMWHDGQPVTMDDVLYTFEHYKMHNVAAFQRIDSIEEVSDTSIRLTFNEPTAFGFMHSTTLTTYLVPKHIWEAIEEPRTYSGEDAVIGCGPFRFVSVDRDAQISYYEAMPDYPIGNITIDRVELKSYDDQTAIIMAMINNEVDVMYTYSAPLDHSMLDVIAGNSDIEPGGTLDPSTYQLIFGFGKYPSNDYNFRKGLSYAFNYELISQVISGEHGQVATTGAASPSQKGYDPSFPLNARDLDKANEYLDLGGFIDIDNDGYRELPDGSQMDIKVFRHYYPPDLVFTYGRIVEVMETNLAEVGIRISLDEQAWSDNQEYILSTMRNNEYELMLITTPLSMVTWGSITNYVADLSELSGRTFGSYQDPEYLDAYKRILFSTNYDDYEAAYRDVQRMNAEDVTAIVWDITTSFYPHRTDKLTGWINYPGVGVVHGDTWYNTVMK